MKCFEITWNTVTHTWDIELTVNMKCFEIGLMELAQKEAQT